MSRLGGGASHVTTWNETECKYFDISAVVVTTLARDNISLQN